MFDLGVTRKLQGIALLKARRSSQDPSSALLPGPGPHFKFKIILKRLISPRLLRRRESKRYLFVVDSLDKQIQNEKGLIRLGTLASAQGGGLFCICVENINLT